jgi:hypothetical protein
MEETPETSETPQPRKIGAPLMALAVAGVVLGGSLIAGIGSFAFAQEATETPSATEQATPQATDDGATTDDGTTDDGTADDERECDKEEDAASSDDSTTTSGLTF